MAEKKLPMPVKAPWTPPEAPTLLGPEIDRAIKSGGFPGLLNALRAKFPDPVADHADISGIASGLVDQYRAGEGAPEHAEIMAQIDRCIVSADLLHQAMVALGHWLADNPGKVVIDGAHSSGKRRVF